MAKKLFDLGFDGGVTSSAAYEEDGDIITTETMPASVVQKILDANKEVQSEHPLSRQKSTGSLGVVGARIPITEHHKWRQEWKNGPRLWGQPWHVFLKKKINSPEFSKFRFMNI